MKKYNLFFVIIYTLFVFVSCSRVNKKGLEVKILTQTKSESVYYIKKSDTIGNRCYVVREDGDNMDISVTYTDGFLNVNALKRKNKDFAISPIAKMQRGYRETLQEMTTFLKVISSKYPKGKQINLHCGLDDFSDIAIIVSQRLPEFKCKNGSQIEANINNTTLKADFNSILEMNDMSVQSISLDIEAKSLYMNKELFLSNHIVSIKNIPQKILTVPILISVRT